MVWVSESRQPVESIPRSRYCSMPSFCIISFSPHCGLIYRLQKRYVEVPMNVTWLGNRIFADVFKWRWGHFQWEWAPNPAAGLPCLRKRRDLEADPLWWVQCGDGGKDGRLTHKPQNVKECQPPPEGGKRQGRIRTRVLKEAWPCQHIDSQCLASTTGRR